MIRALTTAATGMEAQQTYIDVTSNNLANVNTTGYKKTRANFQDLMYQIQKAPGCDQLADDVAAAANAAAEGVVRGVGTTPNCGSSAAHRCWLHRALSQPTTIRR